MMDYPDALLEDMETLYPYRHFDTPISTPNRIMRVLLLARALPLEFVVAQSPSMETNVGKAVLTAAEHQYSLGDVPLSRYECCRTAEAKLYATMLRSNLSNPTTFAPTFYSFNGEIVAIHKSDGEQTVYALDTVPELHLIAGCFFDANTSQKPKKFGYSTNARIQALPEDTSFTYLRPSSLLVPLSERTAARRRNKKRPPNTDPAMSLTHSQIIRAVKKASESAREI